MARSSELLVLPIALPIAAAFLMPVVANVQARLARWLGIAVVVAALGVAAMLAVDIAQSGPLVAALGGFAPPLGITLYADGISITLLIALLAGGLLFWAASPGDNVRSHVLMVLLMGAGSGLALSGDLFNLFVFYEITAVASYGLVAGRGSGAEAGAALRYLIVGTLGSSLALLGIALVYASTGTLNLADIARLAPERLAGVTGMAAFLLLVLGFGVKAELTPVNTWVPEVYATASARVASLLAGIVSKLAIVIVMRIVVLAFPGEQARELLLVLGIAGVVAGEFAALGSATLIQALSYSSVSQLGLVAIAFAISGTAGVAAGLALALHHALVKPAFFMLAANWRGPIDGLAGAAKATPVAAAVFVFLALSIVGVPPLPGFWAKYLLVTAALAKASPLVLLAIAVVLAAVVVEAAYMFRIAVALYGQPAPERSGPAILRGDLARATLLAAGLAVVTLTAPAVLDAIHRMAAVASDRDAYIAHVLPERGARAALSVSVGVDQRTERSIP